MTPAYLAGLFWLLVAGVMQGAFPLPMKFTRHWKWEHLWLWYSLLAFFVLPLAMAIATVPEWESVYHGVPAAVLVQTAAFGLAWGAGSVLYGLGIDALGMTLGFPIMTALTTALGAFIPLAVLTPDLIWKRNGLLTIAGNIVIGLGVVACSIAGDRREKQLGRSLTEAILGPRRSFASALTICIVAGLLSAMFNFGYAFGQPIMDAAVRLGATKDDALNSMWLVMLPAGGLLNLGYCGYLLGRNRTLALGSRSPADWIGGTAMALLWTGSVVIYGWGANALGRLGPTLGWSLWNAILIATTVICGMLTREWEGVRGGPLHWLCGGLALLVAGTFVLGAGVQ